MSLIRTYRVTLRLSQSAFAARLNVPRETYRTWDSGRREAPQQLLARARVLAEHPDDSELLPLPMLASMVGVHVRTLHAAARSGRLVVAYDTRTTFRRLRPRATLASALAFRGHYYGTRRRPPHRPPAADLGIGSRRFRCSDSGNAPAPWREPSPTRWHDWRSRQGRRLPMGGAEAHAIAALLATHPRT